MSGKCVLSKVLPGLVAALLMVAGPASELLAKAHKAAGTAAKKAKNADESAPDGGVNPGSPTGYTELALPLPGTSVETLKGAVTAAARINDQLIAMPRVSGDVLVAIAIPYHAKAHLPEENPGARDERFGKITDQMRRTVAKGEPASAIIEWRAVLASADKTLLFDGAGMTFFETDPAVLSEVSRRCVPWDQVAPPRDRGGEGTKGEIATFRARFAAAIQRTIGVRIAGLAAMPPKWAAKSERGVTYFAATRIPGFPLLTIGCRGEDPSQCIVERACDLVGAPTLRPADIAGIAAVNGPHGEHWLLIGDASTNVILTFTFQSCMSVPRTRNVWHLPPRIAAFTNFSVDADGQLWVTSARPDDYLNASVYFWKKGAW